MHIYIYVIIYMYEYAEVSLLWFVLAGSHMSVCMGVCQESAPWLICKTKGLDEVAQGSKVRQTRMGPMKGSFQEDFSL